MKCDAYPKEAIALEAGFDSLDLMGAMVYAIACICWGAIAFLPPEWLQKILDLSYPPIIHGEITTAIAP